MEIINGLLAALLVFVIPVNIGHIIFVIFKKSELSLERLLSTLFSLGGLVVYLFYIAHFYIGFPVYSARVAEFLVALVVIWPFAWLLLKRKSLGRGFWKRLDAVIICLPLALLSQFIWKWRSGIYSSLDWDTFFHQAMVNHIVRGDFAITLSKISDSVLLDAYSSLFHTLIAVPFQVFNPSVTVLWWFLGFFQLLLVTLSSYLLGISIFKYVSKDTEHVTKNAGLVGFVTALFGSMTFISVLAYNPYFLIPQILASTIAINAFSNVLNQLKAKNHINVFVELVPTLVFIFLLHYILGTFCAVILTCIIIGDYLFSKLDKYNASLYLRNTCIGIVIAIPFIFKQFNFSVVNQNESSFYSLSLLQKFYDLNRFYSYIWILLLPLGLVFLAKNKSKESTLIFIVFTIIAGVIVAPIPYNLKFLAFGSFIFHTIAALGLLYGVSFLNNKTKNIVIALLGIALLLNVTNNVIVYKHVPSYQNVYTHLSPNEIATALYLKAHYSNKNVLVVSDPATMFMIEAISGLNSPGGAYALRETRQLVADIYFNRNNEEIKNNVLSIKDDLTGEANIYLLVLSHRYFDWVQGDESKLYDYFHNVWQPIDLKLEDFSFISFLSDRVKLPVVYSNAGVVVLEVSR